MAATEPAAAPGQALRRQLEDTLAANRALRGRNAVLELRCATLMTDPRTASLPEELAAEAAALLGRLRAELAAAGVDDEAVRSVVGDFDLYVLRLVAAVWRRDGRLPADPPAGAAQVRRLEVVSAS